MGFFDVFRSSKKTTLNKVGGDSPRPRAVVRAKFDAAQHGGENARHWLNADSLAADAAANPAVRKVLRERSRYEAHNNSYARGMILTLADNLIGTGPRLQITAPPGIREKIERDFSAWAKAVNLPRILRIMKTAKTTDGETFAQFITNKKLPNPVKLDIRVIECDRVTSPFILAENPNEVDGILFDTYGNPKSYNVAKYHPGGDNPAMSFAATTVPASQMIHWFRADRPEQHRGIPELMPALPLFAQLRRYTLATLAAAETAANFAGVLEGEAPAGTDYELGAPFEVVDLERNTFTTLPMNYKLSQLKPEQPTSTYAEFKKEILNEIARCVNMPYNVVAGNSSGYNYASGRLDNQNFDRSTTVERSELEANILTRVFYAWLAEANIVNNYNIDSDSVQYAWFWDGRRHVDPAKEANAQNTRLKSGTTNLAREYAAEGLDWEVEMAQALREKCLRGKMIKNIAQEIGITEEEAREYAEPTKEKSEPAE